MDLLRALEMSRIQFLKEQGVVYEDTDNRYMYWGVKFHSPAHIGELICVGGSRITAKLALMGKCFF